MKRYLYGLFYSFPVQLLLLHIRDKFVLLCIWVLLAMSVSGQVAKDFGIRYLFVSPEYKGIVSGYSFFWVGGAFGFFVMCWHLSTYLLDAYRFPFLATIRRPFWVFCFNNSIIPSIFFIFYLYNQATFESYYEMHTMNQYINGSVGFVLGSMGMVVLINLYFAITNKNIQNFLQKNTPSLQILMDQTEQTISQEQGGDRALRVSYFVNEIFRVRPVPEIGSFDRTLRKRVFRQNHYNALFLQAIAVIALIILGNMGSSDTFKIPAGASIFLLCSLLVSAAGALAYWFRKWQLVVVGTALVILNFVTNLDYFNQTNKAYGLNFNVTPVQYITDSLRVLCTKDRVESDKAVTLSILEKWRLKNEEKGKKPRMLLVCVSGGGLKATAWVTRVLQTADSTSNGQFMSQTALITGASGGMLGAGYYRELVLRKQAGDPTPIYSPAPMQDITKDLLNAISFSIVTNDLFLPRSSTKSGMLQYRRDRGYAFERQLHENTAHRMDKALSEYALPEQSAAIPMLFVTPSILNDGRFMVISPQPVSYMMEEHAGESLLDSGVPDAVDFGALFRKQGAGDLRFSTALRANATFPFVLPNIQLPSEPAIELVDAGFRDNVGLKSALRFAHTFNDWISTHTSGVTIVVIRAYDPNRYAPNSSRGGLLSNLLNPISFAGNFLALQEYEYQNDLGFLQDKAGMGNLQVLNFNYIPNEDMQDAPTSFHLTSRERMQITHAVRQPANQHAFQALMAVLKK